MGILERIQNQNISRRNFVALSSATAASLALAGCSENTVTDTVKSADEASSSQVVYNYERLDTGTWKTAGCWLTCHCGCKNMAHVVDGMVIRQKTDDTHEDTLNMPQQRGCVKGRSLRQFVNGADRIKYPMKRKHWEPGGGGGDVTLRGRDEWERLSWDEAIEITAKELTRIMDTYGPKAFGNAELAPQPLLAQMGGYTAMWGQQSRGAFNLVANVIKGSWFSSANDRFSMAEAELVVLWGFNPIWGAAGSNTHYINQARKNGARIIVVDPWLNPTVHALGADWIPCRPGTDGALLAAIAYHMIENDLQDQDFLDTYCVGFDADHMPEGEENSENFKDYILGTYDGTPKTPEWAAPICGASPDSIRELATAMATTKPMTLKAGQAITRTSRGDETAHMFYTVGWMTGNVGKMGAEVSAADGSKGANGGGNIVSQGSGTTSLSKPANPIGTGPRGDYKLEKGLYDENTYYGIPGPLYWKSIKDGKSVDFTRGEQDVTIKCSYKIGLCAQFNQNVDLTTGIEVLRTPGLIDFRVASELVMSPDAQYSDIIFPATSYWEREGGYTRSLNRESLLHSPKLMEPLFEAKSDWEINRLLSKAMGIGTDYITGPVEADGITKLANATLLNAETGEKDLLATVSQDDIDKYGMAMEPQEGLYPLEELVKNGGYQVERASGDGYTYIAMEDFIADPIANPLTTSTGKLEIFSRTLVEKIDEFGTTSINPIPKYVEAVEGYEQSLTEDTCKFQMISLHTMRQAHVGLAEVKSLNEIFANSAMINSYDAEKLGLKTDDTALFTNPHGKSIRRVQVSSRVMPGVVIMGQGNWVKMNEETGIDENFNVNTMTGGYLEGQGQCQFNTVLLGIEKYEGEPLQPDYLRPQVVVEV